MKTTLFFFLFCSSCSIKDPEALQTATVGNGYRVERIFAFEGCTLYRFYESMHGWHYYSNCAGSVSNHHVEGKASIHEEIPTFKP